MNPFPNRVKFSISFPGFPESVEEVWLNLVRFLEKYKSLPGKFEIQQLAGHPEKYKNEQYLKLAPDEIAKVIVERKLNGFWVTTGHSARCFDFRLLDAKNLGRQSTLSCHIGQKAKLPDDWKPLIEQLMRLFPAVGAWQWKSHYGSWQDTTVRDDAYERLFGEFPPKARIYIEKGVPGIADRVRIDAALNPGRSKQLIPTVSFYPTAEMWLGPHFWQYAKCSKEEVLAADFFIEKRDTPHFLYLKSWPEPFTRPDGEQGRQQQRLWKLFFHEDCEWPPGSGTICDEPMYGPPELMPGYVPPSR